MAADDMLVTDDYVAGLLAKDAKDSSIKYSSMGLDAFKQSKPPANKPKPNTRFLRNIIKDTDSHNAALLAKEAAESRARLEGLSSNEHREERARGVGGGDIRRRQLGDIAAILGGRPPKRRRTDDTKRDDKPSRRANTSSEDEEPINKYARKGEHRDREEEREDRRGSRRHRHRSRGDEGAEDSKHSSHRRRQRSTSRDRDNEKDHRTRHRNTSRDRRREKDGHRKRRSPSRSPGEHRSRESQPLYRLSKHRRSTSPEADRENSHRSHRHPRSPPAKDRDIKTTSKTARREAPEGASDSDPLDEIIGPRPASTPAVRSRGRGFLARGSGIEDRFSASYDPTADVQLDPEEEDDWDQALEALRDRQKWKQAGADRLRAAGFTDEEISKWEKGGEKTEEDVKWAKRGEDREWDRGKVIDSEGSVSVDLNWGRLKDT